MTSQLPYVFVGVVVGIVVSLGGVLLYRSVGISPLPHSAMLPAQPPAVSQGYTGHTVSPAEPARTVSGPTEPAPPSQDNVITISPERLQSIGVRFGVAERRSLERTIRTVGRVEIDERRLAHVNIKIEGWIDELYVNYTGEQVTRGQLLFTVYSPELVATQREFLLALRSSRTLGESQFPEVAEGAQSLLDVTRQRLQLWDIPQHQIRDLERTGTVLRTLHIHSPITGTVINKVALAGMHVNPGDELYAIADLSYVWILADIYEYELPLIEVGQAATVTLSYAPSMVLEGRVEFIYPTVDPQTRTAKIRFGLGNPGERLKPGMYANVEFQIPLGTRLVIPREAVLDSRERQVVFISHGGGVLEWRSVQLGLQAGDWVEVREGVQAGEQVVTSANFLIDSESRLKAAVGGMHGVH
jgi:Cu(I)/Ag(I) efflux system membrane fusion protein